MSEFTVAVQVGDVVRVVDLIETSARDATDLMKDVLLVMIRSVQQNFEAGGRPKLWDPLKQSTILHRLSRTAKGRAARKAVDSRRSPLSGAAAIRSQERYFAAVSGIQILRDTGLLAQSVGAQSSGAFASGEGFGESDATSATIGTSQPGWQNQLPDTRGWRDAREFLLFQDIDEEDVSAMAIDFLMRAGPYAAD